MTAATQPATLGDPGFTTRARPAHPDHVFAVGLLAGHLTVVVGDSRLPLPVHRWTSGVSRSDRAVLDDCVGSVVDLGCGPGRMAGELSRRGHRVLGVDRSSAAARAARAAGVPVARQDLFAPVAGEGTWGTALLADGNIGIGGDPDRMLRRATALVRPGGRVVVDLAGAGVGVRVDSVHLCVGDLRSTSFPWAQVGPAALPDLARDVGLDVQAMRHRGSRWWAVLKRTGP